MKLISLPLIFLFSVNVPAKWTTEPIEAGVVWNFDRNCVDLKLKDGKILRVKKEILGNRRLEARKTVIEFHKGSLDNDLCK